MPRVALACIALLAAGRAAAVPAGHYEWIEVRTPNFVIVSAIREPWARHVAEQLETFRAMLPLVSNNMQTDARLPTQVVIFRNGSSFDPYKSEASAAVSVFHREASFMALNGLAYAGPGGRRSTPPRDLFHEATHLYLGTNFQSPPLWANEGLAEYFSTFRLHRGQAEVGRPIRAHLKLLRVHPWLPLETLVDLKQKDHSPTVRNIIFYAQSWALVHYLVSSGPLLADRFHHYLQLADQGMPSLRAFRSAFGDDLSGLESELRSYVLERNDYRFARLEVKKPDLDRAVFVRALRRDEVLTVLGDLISKTRPEDVMAAEAHYREALQLRPDDPRPWLGLGSLLERTGRRDPALEALRRSIALEPSAESWYRLGRVLLARLLRDGGDLEPDLGAMRAAFETAVRLDRDHVDAWAALGASFALGSGDPEAGIDALRAAAALAPTRMDVRYNLIVLRLAAKDPAGARREAANGLTQAPEALVAAAAAAARGLIDPEQKGARHRRDDLDGVLAALDAGIDAAVPDTERRQSLRDWLALIPSRGASAAATPGATPGETR